MPRVSGLRLMYCPFCAAEDTKVVDSRLSVDGKQIRRRRFCLLCKERFNTVETAELILPAVVKRDGSREAFSLEKLARGLKRALERRPVSVERLDALIRHIQSRAIHFGHAEIPTEVIGEWVMEELFHLDQVAYVRFASVYRSFNTIEAFQEEIQRLSGSRSLDRDSTALEKDLGDSDNS